MWTGAVWTTAQSHLSHHSTVDLWTISHGLVYRKLECGTEEGFWKESSSLAAWSGPSKIPVNPDRETVNTSSGTLAHGTMHVWILGIDKVS